MRILLLLILSLSFLLLAPLNKSFASVLFSDNFNDNDISDWQETRNSCRYNSNKANWLTSNGMVGIKINGGGCVTELIPKIFRLSDDTDYKYSFDMFFPNDTNQDRNIVFKFTDTSNWYDLKFYGNSMQYQKVISGRDTLQSTIYPFIANNSYHFDITYSKSKILISINNQDVWELAESNPYLSSSTIGLQASAGANPISEVWFDNIVVSEAGIVTVETNLEVPLLMQTSIEWKNTIYDSANIWSPLNPTIGRWGCAITSAAMVFKFHGINLLPDGTQLTPATLNTWLKNQKDGYVSNGLLNWVSLTRLSKQSKNINNLPYEALEYSRREYDPATLTENLKNKLPIILEEPGHFIVAKGTHLDSFVINDPYFSNIYLSDYNNYSLSSRVYKPSYTDLSYIVISSTSDVNVELKDSFSSPVGDKFTEKAILNEGNSSGKDSHFLYLQKPTLKKYKLIVSSAQTQNYLIEIFLYDANGNVKVLKPEGIVSEDNNDIYEIYFDRPNSENDLVTLTANPSQTKTDLNLLFLRDQFKNKGIYTSLLAKLDNATRTKNQAVRSNILKAAENELNAQIGKSLTRFAYEIMMANIQSLMSY